MANLLKTVPAVGDGVTVRLYSDAQAFTVVAVSKSGKVLTLRRDKATLLNGPASGEPDALKCSPGGFAAHWSGTQRYSYAHGEDGEEVKAHFSEKHGLYYARKKSNLPISEGRHEHYDYNF